MVFSTVVLSLLYWFLSVIYHFLLTFFCLVKDSKVERLLNRSHQNTLVAVDIEYVVSFCSNCTRNSYVPFGQLSQRSSPALPISVIVIGETVDPKVLEGAFLADFVG